MKKVKQIRKITVKQPEAIIRDTLERSSSDSEKFIREDEDGDIFYSKGFRSGIWGIREKYINYYKDEYDDYLYEEGHPDLKEHIIRERSPQVIQQAKEKFKEKHNSKLFCQICGFDFSKTYGKLGENFIEGHHIIPISSIQSNSKTGIEDIYLVCSNCHSMLHQKGAPKKVEDYYKILIIEQIKKLPLIG
ncbi:MAG: HNH endonuclease [Mucispirillum sp.]|nr:HNH endonuclease [Mucispirillum sp.]